MQDCFHLSAKSLLAELVWIIVTSFPLYFTFYFLCRRFLPSMLPYVIFAVVVLSSVLTAFAIIIFKTYRIYVKSDILELSWGSFIRRKRLCKLSKVLSVKRISTPLLKVLGLAAVILIFEGSICTLPPISTALSDKIYRSIHTAGDKNDRN